MFDFYMVELLTADHKSSPFSGSQLGMQREFHTPPATPHSHNGLYP